MCWRIFVTSLKNVSIITLYTCLGHLSFSGRGRSSVEFYLQHLPVFSPPELCLCSNDRSAGWQGLWEGRSEDGHQQWGLDAGSGEDMRRDTAESKREVRELGRDSPGALPPAEQGKEGSPQQKCSEVAAWISFWDFPCAGHHISSSSARLKAAVLSQGPCKGLHPSARSQHKSCYPALGYKTRQTN